MLVWLLMHSRSAENFWVQYQRRFSQRACDLSAGGQISVEKTWGYEYTGKPRARVITFFVWLASLLRVVGPVWLRGRYR